MNRRVALFGDTHWGVRNDHPAFLENAKRSSEWMIKTLDTKYRDVSDVIHTGDLYDRKKYINFETANACREYLLEPLARNFMTHVIMGNHDVYHKNTHEINSLREMVAGKFATIQVYSSPHTITISGIPILLMPWVCDSNRALAETEIKSTKAEILVGHLELSGFEMYKNVIMTHGEDPNAYNKFKGVYSGHYHRKSSKGNIHYIGALGEYIWSDYDCPRGFSILDLDTLELTFERNPYAMFNQVRYDDTNYQPGDFKNLDFSHCADTFVKVIVEKKNDAFAFDRFIDKLYEANPIEVSVIDDVSSFVDNEEDEAIDEAQDTPSILDGYISGLSLPVDVNDMKRYMRDVYKEAITINEDVK